MLCVGGLRGIYVFTITQVYLVVEVVGLSEIISISENLQSNPGQEKGVKKEGRSKGIYMSNKDPFMCC